MIPIVSSAVLGIQAVPVFVEADISKGMNNFTIVGLPDASVKEARDRIRAALKYSGFAFPRGRVTVNLAPAHIRKQGSLYDLPIALAILCARGELPFHLFAHSLVLGELALDGSLRSVQGALASAILAKSLACDSLFLPAFNAQEASVISEVSSYGASSLNELVDHLLERARMEKAVHAPITTTKTEQHCFSIIKGQALAKRGLEIAAAGGHNTLLSGPPGTGKTLLAKSFSSILPPLTLEESIEVTTIASIAGLLESKSGLMTERPFRSPHHSSSSVSLVGGGALPSPGEISLAHRGVLFLDEIPEFSRHALEQLRGPLEDGSVTISRAHASLKFPSRFILLAAMNPCPCGYATDPKRTCLCSPHQIQRYQKKLSGPLLDRFDLCIEVANIDAGDLLTRAQEETSEIVLRRVSDARRRQAERFQDYGIHLNAEISPSLLDVVCPLTDTAVQLLSFAIDQQHLSPRAVSRARKVARTIADLAKSAEIKEEHLAEALQFRRSAQETI